MNIMAILLNFFLLLDKLMGGNKVGIQSPNDAVKYVSSADNFDKPKTASYKMLQSNYSVTGIYI